MLSRAKTVKATELKSEMRVFRDSPDMILYFFLKMGLVQSGVTLYILGVKC